MNQRGFGRLEVIGFLAVVALSLTIVWILVRQLEEAKPFVQNAIPSASRDSIESVISNEFDVDTYLELEEKIALKSIEYFDANQNDDVQTVTIAKLVQNDYIPQVYSLKNHDVICTGYVEYHRHNNAAKTYLKCDLEYQTPEYNTLNDYSQNE